ncbi:MAG TPA: hypothetical protein IGS53_27020 [Leptolyngbyaceae cyanobacterium M33_DOE_097]|uniref:Uncharacterized protein n=1 Tax=Oscillatoriales cyanobacterium SpSt-418 TaxID=2282169 RepID=A0A7C3PGC7_9CYAN|nr:hypothetical protein [Leptolyngbyaceae cyanobacterium M33_DOE_097]
MKHNDRDHAPQSSTKDTFLEKKIAFLSNGKQQEWIRFITVVLAFIGLWRVLEGSLVALRSLL